MALRRGAVNKLPDGGIVINPTSFPGVNTAAFTNPNSVPSVEPGMWFIGLDPMDLTYKPEMVQRAANEGIIPANQLPVFGSTMMLDRTTMLIDGGGSLGDFGAVIEPDPNLKPDPDPNLKPDPDPNLKPNPSTIGYTVVGNTGRGNDDDRRGATSGTEKRNAREFLVAALRPYFASASDAGFLKDLESIIDDYIKQDYDQDTISVLLPQTKPYLERFKGNVARAAAGLSQLTPAEYIQAEEQYNEVLKRFNLGSLSSRDTFANLISGQVSAAELTDRVVNVYDRIRNADPALKSELDRVKELSAGQLSEADFAKALLTGDTGANELKRKITVAEIGAEARTRGLETTRAQQLEQLGVTREQARAGFEQIGLTQPRLTQLSEIYTRTTPDASGLQEELEREQFQGMQSQRRRRLAEQETATFMGQSGTAGSQSLARRRTGSI